MAISPTTTCNCPVTGTVELTFTGSSPTNGYLVGYRKAGTSDALTSLPNAYSSPYTASNIPRCNDLEFVMQAQCDNSQLSAPVTSTPIAAYTNRLCGDSISANHTHNGAYTYPVYLLNVQAATDTITITYDAIDLPNKFVVKDFNDNTIADSGWRGTANYSGPWSVGPTVNLNTPSSGFLSFSKGSNCYLRLFVYSVTNTNTEDAFTFSIACPSEGGSPVVPVFNQTYSTCSSGDGSYRIEAPAGTTMKVGLSALTSLTNTSETYCARAEATITSSTGESSNELSSVVSTTGSRALGQSNNLFVNVTVPGTGYITISTNVYTRNSAVGTSTAQLTIFEVNGAAANITQAVCVGSRTGVVSCGTPTIVNYLATRYTCGPCTQTGATNGFIVAFSSSISVTQGKFYVPSTGSGQRGTYVYLVGAVSPDGPGVVMDDLSATTCAQACSLTGPV